MHNKVTKTFISLVRGKHLLCFVHGQGQKSEQKHTAKNFEGFHNHSPLLTMFKLGFNANFKRKKTKKTGTVEK